MKSSGNNTRRSFIKHAAVLAVAPGLAADNTKPQILHQVFFWLKDPASEADKKALITGLRTLKKIPQVKKLLIGLPASTAKRDVVDNSFQISELMYFNSTKDQDEYQVHPVHKAFVEKCSHLWEKVIVYDMTVV